MFPIKLESSMTIIIFGNLKFPKNGTYLYIMGPLRADSMSAYSLGKITSLSEL